MANHRYLKKENTPLVILFIVWCLALYLTFQVSHVDFWNNLSTIFEELRVEDGLFMIMSPLLALVFTGLLSSEMKARLVFFRWKNPLPGNRAFSRLGPRDPRIRMQVIEGKLGEIPEAPMEQNTAWYSLYRRYASVPTVEEAHKAFLLSRDLTALSFLFILFGSVGLLLLKHGIAWSVLYALVMAIHFVLLAVVAQNHGRRLVCNVLVEYSIDTNP